MEVTKQLTVHSPTNTYDIIVQPGLLNNIQVCLDNVTPDTQFVIATNTTLTGLYGEALASRLPHASLVVMEDGEEYKTLETVARIYDALIDSGADRSSVMLALGGGVVGDTMGFVAATYMRGIRLVQIPTTLLSMVDSSVGGKVGVDLPQGKNLVGAFKQPDAVLIDPDVIQTLPEVEWRSGMAEVLKHGLLADPKLLDDNLHQPENIVELLLRAIQVKVDIVEADPYEQGVRAFLNLGHTFAHAIEQVSGYKWHHGYAVGFGLLAAVKLSFELEMCSSELVETVQDITEKNRLPQRLDGLNPEDIYLAMMTDKKWKQGRSRFVVLEAIAEPALAWDVPKETVIKVLESMQ